MQKSTSSVREPLYHQISGFNPDRRGTGQLKLPALQKTEEKSATGSGNYREEGRWLGFEVSTSKVAEGWD
jgi:hypothetical protein